MSAIASGIGPLVMDTPTPTTTTVARFNPKFGILIPNRVFVGGISSDTTEAELGRVFSAYGHVKSTKIIVDRLGKSKGYGFVTFETEEEARRLQMYGECVVLRDRKLNIAPAIRKAQKIITANDINYFNLSSTNMHNNNNSSSSNTNYLIDNAITDGSAGGMHLEQIGTSIYFPTANMTASASTSTTATATATSDSNLQQASMQYESFCQYYNVPLNIGDSWTQRY